MLCVCLEHNVTFLLLSPLSPLNDVLCSRHANTQKERERERRIRFLYEGVCWQTRLLSSLVFFGYLLSSMKNSEREQRGKNRPIKKETDRRENDDEEEKEREEEEEDEERKVSIYMDDNSTSTTAVDREIEGKDCKKTPMNDRWSDAMVN